MPLLGPLWESPITAKKRVLKISGDQPDEGRHRWRRKEHFEKRRV